MHFRKNWIGLGFALALAACAAQNSSPYQTLSNMKFTDGNILLVPVEKKADANCAVPLIIKAEVPTKVQNDGRAVYVPVSIAGQPYDMVVDTGAAYSVIQDHVLTSVGGTKRDLGDMGLIDAAGIRITQTATVPSFQLGKLSRNDFEFFLGPNFFWSDNYTKQTGRRIAGLFGIDVLSRYDLEINAARGTFKLLSQTHCPGRVVYWADDYTVVPMVKRAFGYTGTSLLFAELPYVEVELNGVKALALIDTGAEESVVDIDFAQKAYGLKIDIDKTPFHVAVGAANGGIKIFPYVFKTLQLGGAVFQNPHMNITKLNIADVVIGMRQLRMFHLYFAFGEGRLYMTHWNATKTPKTAGSAGDKSAANAAH